MLEKTIFKDILDAKKGFTNFVLALWGLWYFFILCVFTAAIALRPEIWTSPFVPTPTVFVLEVIVFAHMVVSLAFEISDWLRLKSRFYFACFKLFTVLSWLALITYFAAIVFRFLQMKVTFIIIHIILVRTLA